MFKGPVWVGRYNQGRLLQTGGEAWEARQSRYLTTPKWKMAIAIYIANKLVEEALAGRAARHVSIFDEEMVDVDGVVGRAAKRIFGAAK